MKAYWRSKGYLLTPALKEIRQIRTEHLLLWHIEKWHGNILFTEENIFTIKEQSYRQNGRIYDQTSCDEKEKVPRVQRGHHTSYDMVCGVVPSRGDTASFLRERCENWCPSVSKGVVKPINTVLFNGQKWVFQKDSAPAHKAKTTQEWLRRHVPIFFSAEGWPSGVQTSTLWTTNCGLFWRTGLAESIRRTWIV